MADFDVPAHVVDVAVDHAEALWRCYPHTLSDFRTDVAWVAVAVLKTLAGQVEPLSDGLGVKSRGDLGVRRAVEDAKEPC